MFYLIKCHNTLLALGLFLVSPVLVPVSLLGTGLPGAGISCLFFFFFLNEDPTFLTEDFGSTL